MLTIEINGAAAEKIIALLANSGISYTCLTGSNPPTYFLVRIEVENHAPELLKMLIAVGDEWGVQVNEHP